MSTMSTLVTAQDETLDRRKGREKLRHVGGVRAVPLAVLVAEEALLAPRLEREQREERHGEQQPLEGERDQTKAEAGREQASVHGVAAQGVDALDLQLVALERLWPRGQVGQSQIAHSGRSQ